MKVKHEMHCWVMDDSYHKVLDSCTLAKKENSIGWLQQNEIFDKESLWWFMYVLSHFYLHMQMSFWTFQVVQTGHKSIEIQS